MIHAVLHRVFSGGQATRPVHGLQEKMRKIQGFKALRRGIRLQKDKFQFVALRLNQWIVALRAHTDPVDSRRCGQRAIGFYGNLEAFGMDRVDKSDIQLQQRFAAGKYNIARTAFGPQVLASVVARVAALANLPPPMPLVPTKSVSQNVQAAVARSISRPDHKLHPANRQKTAARPLAPLRLAAS
ncbi:hypothetical protein TKWG_16290 [Advenella kashmirensis WT001]|uniref:Uncharacterized protein n=1 Tax=Advenella kashmirensis (strain DSM 17095 / LMG 22695 / WT001) TaxID=1036672 RepID=I3UDX3_ADVKW|nr:hypothetical protein TKWG_16290 [Advenella kashmirensis WT001]